MNKNKLLIFALLLISITTYSQTKNIDTIWHPMKFFVGEWTGQSDGQPGTGHYQRTYEFIFNNKFIEINNKSTWEPTDRNPDGEVHKDKGYISYDKARKLFVLRQFHIEGFINKYKLDSISPDKKTIVFISENIENIPAGWRAKETYKLINSNEFVEIFELAAPDKPFQEYSKAILRRK